MRGLHSEIKTLRRIWVYVDSTSDIEVVYLISKIDISIWYNQSRITVPFEIVTVNSKVILSSKNSILYPKKLSKIITRIMIKKIIFINEFIEKLN